MPAPTTVAEFTDLVQKSGVVEAPRLTAYVQQLRDSGSLPADPAKAADAMIRDAVLTRFQAEQLLLGKWKRFTIGRYKVLERLGSGGMGQVFLCEHKLMRRRVAVKVLPSAKANEPSSFERFLREARAIAALDHPNLVRAYDIDTDESPQGTLHFLVMEYVDGANLQEMVKRAGPLDVTRACHYVYHAAEGLQYAFEAGLIHRDVKPGNIMVDRQGAVKLLDLGLARFFNDETDILTRKYDESVLGTADYLAPEQAMDSHAVDIRADIYSLGATFYFMLTGQPPFPDGSVAQKLIYHQTRQPKPVRLLRPAVPEQLAHVIDRMMAKDPAGRFQTPAELEGALAPFVRTPVPPPTDTEMPRLSPAAGGGSGSPAAAAVASGRWAIPPAAALATAPRTPPPVPPRTAATTLRAGNTPRPRPGTPPPPPAKRPGDPNNPFANRMAAAAPAGYATAAERSARTSLPPPRRGGWWVWVAAACGLAASAAGGWAAWHFVLAPTL